MTQKDNPPAADAAMSDADKANIDEAFAKLERMLGAAFNLLVSHKKYAAMPAATFHARLLPPIAAQQFRLVRDEDGNAVAFVAWAMVNDVILGRLEAGEDVTKPGDWRCGDIPVIMDVVAPNPRGGSQLVQRVKDDVFPDKPLKAMRFKDGKSDWAEVPPSPTKQ